MTKAAVTQNPKTKQAVRFFCIAMVVLFLSSIFIWGFQSDWGKVSIKRISITGDNGDAISSLVYLPQNASNEMPAPVVMMFHGRSNQAHSNDTWSMELARRGYVVFSPDLSGGGESAVNDRQAQAVSLTKFVTTLNYVQTDNIVCVGYSAGCGTCTSVAAALPDNVSTVVACLGPNLTNPIEGYDFNFGVIKAVADQYNWEFIGDVQACADAMTERWENELVESFGKGRRMRFPQFVKTIKEIVADFESIPVRQEEKIKVGVVGEIYVKFSPLGNNNLEQFLLSEGCEVIVPGLTDFIIFKIFNRITDIELYGGSKAKYVACKALMEYVVRRQNVMIDIIGKSRFRAPTHFEEIHKSVHEYLGDGNKMGEGWLLTGEMLELIHDGVPNIVCTQPFGCLPNHIVGKGMIRPLKDDYPDSNIVAIDYDPSATAITRKTASS